MRLQGLCASDIDGVFAESDLRALAGNSMSLCVIEPLLRESLIAIGSPIAGWPDRWSKGSAQARLVQDAWGPKPPGAITQSLPDCVANHFVKKTLEVC